MLPTAKPANCTVANIAIPRPRTQPGSANWADTFNVAIAATQEIPASTHAISAVAGSRATANRASASAVPTVAPATTRSAPSLAFAGNANAPQTAPTPIARGVCRKSPGRPRFVRAREAAKCPIDAREREETGGPDQCRAQIRIIASVAQTAANSAEEALGG